MQAVNSLRQGVIELVDIPLNKMKAGWVVIQKVAFQALQALSEVIITMGFWERKEVKPISLSSPSSSKGVVTPQISLESSFFKEHINQMVDDFTDEICLTLDAIVAAYNKKEITLDQADQRLIELHQEPGINAIISNSRDLISIYTEIDTALAERNYDKCVESLNDFNPNLSGTEKCNLFNLACDLVECESFPEDKRVNLSRLFNEKLPYDARFYEAERDLDDILAKVELYNNNKSIESLGVATERIAQFLTKYADIYHELEEANFLQFKMEKFTSWTISINSSQKPVQPSFDSSNTSEEYPASPLKQSPAQSPKRRVSRQGTPLSQNTVSYSQRVPGAHGSDIIQGSSRLPIKRALFNSQEDGS